MNSTKAQCYGCEKIITTRKQTPDNLHACADQKCQNKLSRHRQGLPEPGLCHFCKQPIKRAGKPGKPQWHAGGGCAVDRLRYDRGLLTEEERKARWQRDYARRLDPDATEEELPPTVSQLRGKPYRPRKRRKAHEVTK